MKGSTLRYKKAGYFFSDRLRYNFIPKQPAGGVRTAGRFCVLKSSFLPAEPGPEAGLYLTGLQKPDRHLSRARKPGLSNCRKTVFRCGIELNVVECVENKSE